jgi:opacity protein-like surface antigen
MRTGCVVLLCLLVTTGAAAAQIPAGNVYVGYSFFRADLSSNRPLAPVFSNSNLNGWNGALELKMLPWISGVADFGGNYGTARGTPACEAIIPCPTPFDVRANLHTYLFGPRASVSIGRIRPFAHALFGVSHVSAHGSGSGGVSISGSDTSFSTAIGGGLDYKLIKGIAWRFQGDYLQTRFFSNKQNNFRFSTGIVLNF